MIIYNCAIIQCSLKLFDGMFKKKNYLVKQHLACIFVIFCVCCQIRAAIRKMKLGKSAGPSSKSVELLGHLKTIKLIRSQHNSKCNLIQHGLLAFTHYIQNCRNIIVMSVSQKRVQVTCRPSSFN